MRKFASYSIPFVAFIIFILLWQTSVSIFTIDKWILPAPFQVGYSLWQSKELLLYHSIQTLLETIMGLGIAVLFGFGVAVLMEWSPFFEKLLKPFVIISQTIPFIVLAPLLIIWLGYGVTSKIVVIVLACFFPIAMNTFDGFRSTDRGMIRLLQSMKASKGQIFRLVTLPASMPSFFAGLRVAGAYAVGIAVVSEWLGAERGLGIVLLRAAKSFEIETVFASIVVISVLSLLIVGIIELIARRSIPWHYLSKGGAR